MALTLTQEDIVRYSQAGPRYTSYPTLPDWEGNISSEDYKKEIHSGPQESGLSLYVHIPICEKLCHFCACNRIIDREHSKEVEYVSYLKKEISLARKALTNSKPVMQMHWGGGTPTFLSPALLKEVAEHLFSCFEFDPNAELSIEVNPVVTH